MSDPVQLFVSGLLNSLTLTPECGDAKKVFSFSPDESVDGLGAVTVELTKWEQANPGLPDWYVSVSVAGLTFISQDADGSEIRRLFRDCLASVESWTPAALTAACSANVVGIRPVTNAAQRDDSTRRMFIIELQLVLTDFNFQLK